MSSKGYTYLNKCSGSAAGFLSLPDLLEDTSH